MLLSPIAILMVTLNEHLHIITSRLLLKKTTKIENYFMLLAG